MFKTEGSKAQTDLIEFLQEKNSEHDADYVPQAFHKPNKSLLRRWWDFINIFNRPEALKPCDSLKQGDQAQKGAASKASSKRLQKVGTESG